MDNEKKDLDVIEDSKAVLLQGDPEEQLAFAQKSSSALMEVMKQKPKKVIINGEQYLEFEDWQTVGRFYGASVGTEWTKPIMKENEEGKEIIHGYEARSYVKMNGVEISTAENMCTRDEKLWSKRDDYALRSMAQTRASAKALRNVFAWVVVLAGFRATPSEEMPLEKKNYVNQDEPPFTSASDNVDVAPSEKSGTDHQCSIDGCGVKLTEKVASYSMDKFGQGLCFDHQKNA